MQDAPSTNPAASRLGTIAPRVTFSATASKQIPAAASAFRPSGSESRAAFPQGADQPPRGPIGAGRSLASPPSALKQPPPHMQAVFGLAPGHLPPVMQQKKVGAPAVYRPARSGTDPVAVQRMSGGAPPVYRPVSSQPVSGGAAPVYRPATPDYGRAVLQRQTAGAPPIYRPAPLGQDSFMMPRNPTRAPAVYCPQAGPQISAPASIGSQERASSRVQTSPGLIAPAAFGLGARSESVLQAKLSIRNGPEAGKIRDLAATVRKTGITTKSETRLGTEIRWLQRSQENFGEVDIQNPHQVELLAYRLKLRATQRRNAGGKKRHRPTGPAAAAASTPGEPCDLLIVGAGSTAAYYLDTLGPAADHSKTVVIGGENPWLRQRGHAIPFINHTERQIAMPSENVVEYGGNESFVERSKFAETADKVIEGRLGKTGLWIKTEKVTKVEQLSSGLMQVTYGGKTMRAKKVVFAAGSGEANVPPGIDRLANKNRVIDMDTFIRDKAGQPEKGKVVVWGSNAAIDAVAAAKLHGWEIEHWVYTSDPAWLPGTRYKSDPYNLHNEKQRKFVGRDTIKIEDDGDKLKVQDLSKPDIIGSQVDYVVYGLGSKDLLTDGRVMDKSVLGGSTHLDPILDRDHVLGNPRAQSSPGEQAFLGWQNKQGTFQVFGLAAENYAGIEGKDRSGNASLNRITPTDPHAVALKHWVSDDVLTVGQLSYIRTAVRTHNNYVPPSIGSRVDYSHADANQLRIHLAMKYPSITEEYASHFIEMIRSVRGAVSGRLPHGFTAEQTAYIEDQLAKRERFIKTRGTGGYWDPYLWRHAMWNRLVQLTPLMGEEVAKGLAKLNSPREQGPLKS